MFVFLSRVWHGDAGLETYKWKEGEKDVSAHASVLPATGGPSQRGKDINYPHEICLKHILNIYKYMESSIENSALNTQFQYRNIHSFIFVKVSCMLALFFVQRHDWNTWTELWLDNKYTIYK